MGNFAHLSKFKFQGLGRVQLREIPDGHHIILNGYLRSCEMGSKVAVGETYTIYVLAMGIIIHTEGGRAQQLFTVLMCVSGVNLPKKWILCTPLKSPFELSYILKEGRDLPQVWWMTALRMMALLTA